MPRDKAVQTDWRSSQAPILFTPRCRHLDFFLYIPSMRWVTRNPPKILMQANTSATKPKARAQPLPLETFATPPASSAPTTITDEIAFVTLISGVCSAGVTDHTT